MRVEIRDDSALATLAAADFLAQILADPQTRNVMPAGGNTPIGLYAEIARRGLKLDHLNIFILDEYAGVPLSDPRTCSNLLRRTVQAAWGILPENFHTISSLADEALASVRRHEERIAAAGGLDAVILGLGKNGHIGFNEPGSEPESPARIVALEATSVEANRKWFSGDHAPSIGATVGLGTILAARHIVLLAFGNAKAPAVKAMVEGPPHAGCPASWLQGHPGADVFLDAEASALLTL